MAEALSNFGDHKRLLILWSGGLDSTLMLLEAAKLLKAGSLESVRAVSVEHFGFWESAPAGFKRRQLQRHFKNQLKAVKFSQIKIRHVKGQSIVGGGLQQPAIQLMAATNAAEEGDVICMGVLRYADFWHYNEHFADMARGMIGMAQKDVQWMFPLEWAIKAEVIRELRKYRGAISRCWWCESPKLKKKPKPHARECGKCPTCFKHRQAMAQLRAGKISGEY